MCGIIGSFSNNIDVDDRIILGLSRLHHRGPDSNGIKSFRIGERKLVLGHARLSIIDLSDGGHQPMSKSNMSHTIVFNGEIYNYKELKTELEKLGHKFQSDSDTEVLLSCWSEWGQNCLRKLKGMFSFAIVEHASNVLTLVRDAFGIKPLYYSFEDDNIHFSSETAALDELRDSKLKPNLQTVYDYLVFGEYDNQRNTFFDGIYCILPGHLLKINLNNVEDSVQYRWWNPSIERTSALTFDEAAVELRRLFLENVKLHLRSDVPVGAALSGGLDSSAVVCAMRHLDPKMTIHTFSYIAKNSPMDEEKWVDIVNNHIKAIPHKVYLDSEDLQDDLSDMVKAQGEPFVGTSIYAQYRVFREAKECGIIVTLDGQGADELLGGYSGFPQARVLSLIQEFKFVEAVKFLQAWKKWPGRSESEAFKALARPFMPNSLIRTANRRNVEKLTPNWINKTSARKIGVKLCYRDKDPEHVQAKPRARELMSVLRSTMTGNGLNSLLRHADRNSMRWSIESRVPFLTVDLAEFLLSLPEDYLVSKCGETKSLFRAAMRGIVPDSILDRKDKIGFETPEFRLLERQKEKINSWAEKSSKIPFVDSMLFIEEIKAVFDGKKKYNPVIWRMINVCHWMITNQEKEK